MKKFKKILLAAVAVFAICFCFSMGTKQVFAQGWTHTNTPTNDKPPESSSGGDSGVSAGDTDEHGTDGCKPEYEHAPIPLRGCYANNRGFFWLKIPAHSDYIPIRELFYSPYNYFIFRLMTVEKYNSPIHDCQRLGGYFYILAFSMYKYGFKERLGLGTGAKLSTAWPYLRTATAEEAAGVGEPVTPEEAQAEFAKYADRYLAEFGQRYAPDSDLLWFCAIDDDYEPPTPDTPPSPPTWKTNCEAKRTRAMGNTVTRIAVNNASLDPIPEERFYSDGKQKADWQPKEGYRTGLTHDSGYTEWDADVETIAKPGDSIRFVHEICIGARYVRRTVDQNVEWSDKETHTEEFKIAANKFKIEAFKLRNAPPDDTYAFGNGISLVNDKFPDAGLATLEKPLGDDGELVKGAYVASDGYAIGTLSPTLDNNEYKCSLTQYDRYDPYVYNGSYQIPGFISGQSCNSASLTSKKGAEVGTEIIQQHKYNVVRAWEQYANTHSGSCGCDTNTATYTNYYYPDYPYSNSGSEWGMIKDYSCKLQTKGVKPNDEPSCRTDYVYGYVAIPGTNPVKYNYVPTDWTAHDYYKLNEGSDPLKYKYLSKQEDKGDQEKTATVYIPYNFNTYVQAKIEEKDGIVYQGRPVHSSFLWRVDPRKNKYLTVQRNGVLNEDGYATYTPEGTTKVQMVAFILKPGDHDVTGNIKAKKKPCEFYMDKKDEDGSSSVVDCGLIQEVSGAQNPEGNYFGSTQTSEKYRVVPDDDEYVGYKYCVAVGFFPSDSHNYPATDKIEYQKKYGGNYSHSAMDAGDYWNISNASCRTIAKKPSFQVWNGSVYTEGNVKTSTIRKMVGAKFKNNSAEPTIYNDSQASTFGSWAEYAIIAGGKVEGMASGALLGYDNSRYNLSLSGGQASKNFNTKLSQYTIANNKEASIGESKINASTSIKQNLARLKSRYRDKAKSYAEGKTANTIEEDSATGTRYAYVNNGSMKTLRGDKTMDLLKSHEQEKKKDNTLIIVADGTFTIDENICLGGSCKDDGMKLEDYKNGRETTAAAALPQVLIFAKDIKISQKVTRVDAWLIADEGTIDTCYEYSVGNVVAADGAAGINGKGQKILPEDYTYTYGGNCYKSLIVNGPVYASNLKLSRTAGAFHGRKPDNSYDNPDNDVNKIELLRRKYGATHESRENNPQGDANLGSIVPAEIFNLRADAYIWAFNQAQRYSEAVVTYMRELAPRY